MMAEEPEQAIQNLVKNIAKQWNAMPEENKVSFREQARQDKMRYQNQKRELIFAGYRHIFTEKKERLPTPYILFLQDKRAEIAEERPTLSSNEIVCEIARRYILDGEECQLMKNPHTSIAIYQSKKKFNHQRTRKLLESPLKKPKAAKRSYMR